MRLLEKDLVDKWRDGSIPTSAKSELITKFQRHFGYTDKSTVFPGILAHRIQPTPDQHKYLSENINTYWEFYNPSSEASLSPTTAKNTEQS